MRTPYRELVPYLTALVLAMLVSLCAPATAAAQGRCSCNSGCHMYPGECAHPSSSGCDPGYAPFCGNRAGSCPHAGWVSCDGSCTCVRIPGYDAGTPPPVDAGPTGTDASSPPPDVSSPGTDASSSGTDVPASFGTDVPASGTDVPASGTDVPAVSRMDVPASGADSGPPAASDVPHGSSDVPVSPGTDVPSTSRPDVPVASEGDVPVSPGTDVPSTSRPDVPVASEGDVPVSPGADAAPAGTDASATPCVCPGGVCIAGRCITQRCMYQPELGFVCSTPGTVCRMFDHDAFCVPVCLGAVCGAGQFCDESSGGQCVQDHCAMLQCPVGTSCYHNQCGRFGDGGFFPDDADIPVPVTAGSDGGTGGNSASASGCGCRAGAPVRGGGLAMAALALLLVRRRRR